MTIGAHTTSAVATYRCKVCNAPSAVEIDGFDPTLSGLQREVAEHVVLTYATCPSR